MVEATNGLVVLYSYLWAREHQRGEESGRKDRPACVQVVVGRSGGTITALFPITSQSPNSGATAVVVPAVEARRAGLRAPAWVIVDEWNEDDLSKSPFLVAPAAIGFFSPSFCRTVREAAVGALKAGKFRRVAR